MCVCVCVLPQRGAFRRAARGAHVSTTSTDLILGLGDKSHADLVSKAGSVISSKSQIIHRAVVH